MERTLILFKPDAVQRRLSGRLLARLEEKGLKIVGLKMLRVTKPRRRSTTPSTSQAVLSVSRRLITSGPGGRALSPGPQAVAVVRHDGPPNGGPAAPGTIRGDFGVSRQMNLMHGSDSVEAAQKEIAVYFRPEDVSYDATLAGWVWCC